ncbi:restriction endonuclease subunit S [Leptospira mtsangambouensis]|uniref:restriction endonuclease subunit S n=1 Tax=Leptospira mtsangambouensis TaxID=2484912 RepID=UPI001EE9D398|nr:restriction endonuclease subunit S [Leptospira mtsangambouensis]MCG6140661.1 restriction endonuclease subunit S [Leptospira mtsangambouensis]
MKTDFNETEVGLIPNDWNTKLLNNIFKIVTGNTPPTFDRSYYNGDIPFIGPGDLGENRNIYNSEKKLSEKGYAISRKIPKNSILVTCIGSTTGKTGITTKPSATNQQINALLPNEFINQFFVYYYLSLISRKIRSMASEQAVPLLNKNDFGQLAIPLPPTLSEQQAIATVLSDNDAWIESLEAQIEKKKLIKQGTMQELLTGKRRLPGFGEGKGWKDSEVGRIPEDWEVKKLGDVFNISGGYSASREQLGEKGLFYLHYGDIHLSQKTYICTEIDYSRIPKLDVALNGISKATLLIDGDVVFVDASEDMIGTSRYVVVRNKKNHNFLSGLHTIVAKEKTKTLDNLFKEYVFQNERVKFQFCYYAVGTKVSGISKSSIKKINFPIPPTLAEQEAIANILSEMDEEIEVLEKKVEKAKGIKQGLMQVLLTGKIRLV